MSTTMTLPEIREAVRQRADMVNSEFVSDAELSSYVNQSLFGLYDLLVTTYGEDYFVEEASVATDGTEFVDLPDDFYKLLGVDLLVGGNSRVTLRQFTRMERNRGAVPGVYLDPWTSLRYRLRAGKLWLTPLPQAGLSLKLLYVPKLTTLAEPLTITVTGVNQSKTTNTAYLALSFSGATAGDLDLTPTTGAPGATEYLVGRTDEETAANLSRVLPEALSSAGYTGELLATAQGATVTLARSFLPGDAPLGLVSSDSDKLGVTGGTQTGLTHDTLGLYSFPRTEGETYSDGISGWLEFVVLDAAVKCLQKEESDTRVLQEQRAGIVRRIIDSAPNRDAAEPARVADVTRTGGWDDPGFDW